MYCFGFHHQKHWFQIFSTQRYQPHRLRAFTVGRSEKEAQRKLHDLKKASYSLEKQPCTFSQSLSKHVIPKSCEVSDHFRVINCLPDNNFLYYS